VIRQRVGVSGLKRLNVRVIAGVCGGDLVSKDWSRFLEHGIRSRFVGLLSWDSVTHLATELHVPVYRGSR
jgi:hypothetical protein